MQILVAKGQCYLACKMLVLFRTRASSVLWATTALLIGMPLGFAQTGEAVAPETRNEQSTPRNSILPASPALAVTAARAGGQPDPMLILRSKAILLQLGYDVGSLDAEVTASYRAALFRYQRAHELSATGLLDDSTQQRLGMAGQ